MAMELQRSATSYRRQGSSGIVWDDKFLAQLDKITQQQDEEKQLNTNPNNQLQQEQQPESNPPTVTVGSIERSRSNGGGRAFRTGKVSPAIDPPSPRVSACGFCSAFGKREKNKREENRSRPKSAKRIK